MMRRHIIGGWLVVLLMAVMLVSAQSNTLAAYLQVQRDGVQMQRVNTARWLPIAQESIIGEGDSIRTGESGQAQIRLGDSVLMLMPQSELRVLQLAMTERSQLADWELLRGEVRISDNDNTRHTITTANGHAQGRNGEFWVSYRTNQTRILAQTTNVTLLHDDEQTPLVVLRGARIEADHTLNDIVLADTFAELDSSLDGCFAEIASTDNRQLPVYIAPMNHSDGLGAIPPQNIDRVFGRAGAWYRIAYGNGFGWVQPSNVAIGNCARLRQFSITHQEPADNLPDERDEQRWAYCSGATKVPADWREYVIQAGDSVIELARDFDTSVDRIELFNCIADPNQLIAGHILYLP